jgi:hypothetical protein
MIVLFLVLLGVLFPLCVCLFVGHPLGLADVQGGGALSAFIRALINFGK